MQFFKSIPLILCFNGLVIATCHTYSNEYKLEQLQVLFRHGDRTPTMADIYEGDPYDDIYRSYGYGQLTKVGKKREYKIGQILRKLYNDFLGEYRNDDVYAYSSDIDRTKMSLQLTLAGLYPPTPSTSWSNSVNWIPIPTHYEALDISFLTAANFCPEYNELYTKVASTPEILEVFQKYQDLFQRITNNTGVTISNLFTAFPIYSNLRSALSLDLPLPAWCSKKDFHELEKISAITFKALTYTEQLRRMIAGPIVEQFLKVLNTNDSTKKIYLYGGHEFDVAAFIDAHNITGAPEIHDFGSSLILEKMRGPDNRLYVRLYMWTGVSERLISLKFNNCEKICPLSDYEKIVQPILPNEASRICTSSSVLCKRRMKSVEDIDLDLQLAYLFAGSDLTSFKYMKDASPYTIEKS